MSFTLAFLLLFSVFEAFSQSLNLSDYHYSLDDIKDIPLKKEDLFLRMRRLRVKEKDSICSNRAHLWSYHFYKEGIKGAKIFLFFTPKTGQFEGLTWWYHVAPVINENGKLWVLDGGFPNRVKGPLIVEEWLKEFNGLKSSCKEITAADTYLMELIFQERTFPEVTTHGRYDCYYHVTPPSFWLPSHVAKNVLGVDEAGRPVRLERDSFQKSEVLWACREATTNPFSWVLGKNLNFCRKLVEEN